MSSSLSLGLLTWILGEPVVFPVAFFPAALGAGIIVEQRGPIDPKCYLGKVTGQCTAGSNQPTVETRWYYNRALEECMAYTYYGCGPYPDYPYASWWRCSQACKRPKASNCFGTWPVYTDPTGKARSCSDLRCPDYHECVLASMEPPSPECCDKRVTDAFGFAYAFTSQRCPNGAAHYSTFNPERTWMNDPYFGDSCVDLRCPSGYECVQINWIFAKCCAVSSSG